MKIIVILILGLLFFAHLIGPIHAFSESDNDLDETEPGEPVVSKTLVLQKIKRSPEEENHMEVFYEQQQTILLELGMNSSETAAGLEKDKLKTQNKVHAYSLRLEDLRNSEYAVNIGVGTPPQMMTVILDTGSSNLWVNSATCASESCLIHHRFDSKKSSTYHRLPVHMRVRFGSGIVVGHMAKDTINIGPIHVKNQAIGLIEKAQGHVFMSGAFDGIMGLAFQGLSRSKYDLFVTNVVKQQVLEYNMFSFFYSDSSEIDSAVTFGSPDQSLMRSKMVWVPITRAMYWETSLTEIKVAGKTMVLHHGPLATGSICSAHKPCRAVLDTGTQYFTAPSAVIKQLLAELPHLMPDCSNFHKFPTITFTMGKYNFDVEPRFYILRKFGGRVCRLAFMPLDVPAPRGPLYIFGDMFMRKYYTTYDADNKRLGFALSANIDFNSDREYRAPYQA